MILNRLTNSATRSLLLQPAFCFSAKKKQIELTLRTPYRIKLEIQKPSSRISRASANSSLRI